MPSRRQGSHRQLRSLLQDILPKEVLQDTSRCLEIKEGGDGEATGTGEARVDGRVGCCMTGFNICESVGSGNILFSKVECLRLFWIPIFFQEILRAPGWSRWINVEIFCNGGHSWPQNRATIPKSHGQKKIGNADLEGCTMWGPRSIAFSWCQELQFHYGLWYL